MHFMDIYAKICYLRKIFAMNITIICINRSNLHILKLRFYINREVIMCQTLKIIISLSNIHRYFTYDSTLINI